MGRGLQREQQKEVDLNFKDVPDTIIPTLKTRIGQILVNDIRRFLAEGISPVENAEYKHILNKDYANREKQGNRTANLQLEGDMLSSLGFQIDTGRPSVIVGIMQDSQKLKAQGHNQFPGQAPGHLPMRRFIPSTQQSFRPSIMKKIDDLINSYRVTPPPVQQQSIEIELNLSRFSPETLETRIDDLVSSILASRSRR